MATFQDAKKYPKTNEFLTGKLPLIPEAKPKLFGHFMDYTGMASRDAKDLLTQSFIPKVVVKDILDATGQMNQYGWTPGKQSNEIWLNEGFINDCESLFSGDTEIVSGPYNHYQDQDFTQRVLIPKLYLLLEVTTLHELVHFGRIVMNGENPNRNAEERIAQAFELKAYGKFHTVTTLGIDRFVPEPK